MVNILSIHSGIHDSAAALFDDYRLIAAVQDERLTRTKKSGGPPHAAIAEVLDIGGIAPEAVDVAVFSRAEFPRRLYSTGFLDWWKSRGAKGEVTRDLSTVMIKNKAARPEDVLDLDAVRALYGLPAACEIAFSNHHLAHALPALFFTDWSDALLYTADGAGDNVNYSQRVFKDGAITTLFGDDRWLREPYRIDSLARAYANVTEALGFRPLHHEGKVTGLAAYGEPTLKDAFAAHFRFDDDGLIVSDYPDGSVMREDIIAMCQGEPRENVAASIQALVEDMVVAHVGRLMKEHGVKHLGLAGGLFANVKLNQRLAEICGPEEIFVVPPMGDEGLVVGGALDYLMGRDGMDAWLAARYRLDDVYWGRPFPDMGERIAAFDEGIVKLGGDPVEVAADLLAQGKAVAIVAARMEFGPRALGARSIMASPERRDINDSLNTRLDRSEFMPFAPFIAADDARDVFEVTDANVYACRFMTITCDVKPEWADRIPAVVHVDNTARPQVIERDANPLYYDILKAFKARTGLPTLVNTSFNVHEEPIINLPEEAARALVDDRVDYLVTEDGVYGMRGR